MSGLGEILRGLNSRMLAPFAMKRPARAHSQVLQINGCDEYCNARLSFEDDLMVSYENQAKKRSIVYYPWEHISSIAYK